MVPSNTIVAGAPVPPQPWSTAVNVKSIPVTTAPAGRGSLNVCMNGDQSLSFVPPPEGKLTVSAPAPLVVHSPESVYSVTAAGQVIVGGVVSLTVTVCVHVDMLPDASVAVHVTVVLPTGKQLGASLVILCTVQLSVTAGTPAPTWITAIASAGALP